MLLSRMRRSRGLMSTRRGRCEHPHVRARENEMSEARSETIEVRPLAGHIGAEIKGVDLGAKLSDETIAAVRSTLLKWKVVFFRDQNIGHAEQIAFARRFGELTYAHPHEDEPLTGFP